MGVGPRSATRPSNFMKFFYLYSTGYEEFFARIPPFPILARKLPYTLLKDANT